MITFAPFLTRYSSVGSPCSRRKISVTEPSDAVGKFRMVRKTTRLPLSSPTGTSSIHFTFIHSRWLLKVSRTREYLCSRGPREIPVHYLLRTLPEHSSRPRSRRRG